MAKYKIGDEVDVDGNGTSYTITGICSGDERYDFCRTNSPDTKWNNYDLRQCSCPNQKLIKSKMMNIKEKFLTVFLSEPEKSFRKAEITNGDNLLTADGQTVLLSWLLKKFGAEFKTEVVDVLLAEDKEKVKDK